MNPEHHAIVRRIFNGMHRERMIKLQHRLWALCERLGITYAEATHNSDSLQTETES